MHIYPPTRYISFTVTRCMCVKEAMWSVLFSATESDIKLPSHKTSAPAAIRPKRLFCSISESKRASLLYKLVQKCAQSLKAHLNANIFPPTTVPWAQDCGISQAPKNVFVLRSDIKQMKSSQNTECDRNTEFFALCFVAFLNSCVACESSAVIGHLEAALKEVGG